MAYTPFEGSVSIVPVEKDGDTVLYVNKFSASHGNEFKVPEQVEALVSNLVKAAKARKAKINCNTTQILGQGNTNVHSVPAFAKLAEEFEPMVAKFGWRMYLAFTPNADTKVSRGPRDAKLNPNAIVIE